MIIIERKTGQGSADPTRESKRVPRYQVVMEYNTPMHVPCGVCILKAVFHKSQNEARSIAGKALNHGREAVLVDTREIVETKTIEANDYLRCKQYCHPQLENISFFSERAP